MAKKYEKGEEWKAFQGTYENVCRSHGYKPGKFDKVKFVRELVSECAELQHNICEQADIVNINMYEEAKELTKIEMFSINKNTWNEIITKAITLRKSNSLSDKSIDKLSFKAKEFEYIGQLRTAVNNSFMTGSGDIDILTEINNTFNSNSIKKSSKFMDLINKAADIRINIREMYRKYYEYSRAFQYIVAGKYNHTNFKQMVDSVAYGFNEKNEYGEHHVDNAIRFCKTYKCMNEFNYNEFDEIIQNNGIECKIM